MESYLDHISRHPTLQLSVSLKRFLDTTDIHPVEQVVKKKESQVLDHIGDAILNAFTKVKKADPKFLAIKEETDKLQENICNVEKIHSKCLKSQNGIFLNHLCIQFFNEFIDLCNKLKHFGDAIVSLSTMESQMTPTLSALGTRLENYTSILKNKATHEELDYILYLREYSSYCDSVKDLLKARDQKQIDYEELVNWHSSYSSERDRTAGGRAASGITGFIKDKMNDLKGVDPEKARQDRVLKLNAKVAQVCCLYNE